MSTDATDAQTDLARSNSLADLGARIRAEHRATSDALASSVAHAMAAGDLLIEAKALVPHGKWLPWLSTNCELSERTAQLYMRIAKNREFVEAQIRNGVADLSLNEASALLFLTSDVKRVLTFTQQLQNIDDPEKFVQVCLDNGVGVIVDHGYNVWHGCDEAQKREWVLFGLFLAATCGWAPEGAFSHIEWLRQRPFVSVDELLSESGAKFRRDNGMRDIPEKTIQAWRDFAAERSSLSIEDIEAELSAIPEREPPKVVVGARRSRRRNPQ